MAASMFFGSGPSVDLEPKFLLGLTHNVSGNCLYWNKDVIVFPNMSVIVIFDMKNNSQKFIKLMTEGPRKIITAMDLDRINHVLAVATIDEYDADGQTSDARPVVSIYDLRTLELMHVFQEPNLSSGEEDGDGEEGEGDDDGSLKSYQRRFDKIQFLYDNISMAALVVGGQDGLDCTLYYYSWRTSMVETFVRINGPVADFAPNPIDTAICCFVGNELFQLMTKGEMDWKQYGFQEANGIHFTCVCWLCGDRCLAGTTNGSVMLFKNGELQAIYLVNAINEIDVTTIMAMENRLSFTTTPADLPRTDVVRSCFTFQFGLVLLVGDFTIYHFRKTDEGRRYVKADVFVKEEYRYLKQVEVIGELPMHYIESACVSPNNEILTFITKRPQMYQAPLSQLDKNDNALLSPTYKFEPLGVDLHHGVVESLSTSLWKPILMTCGKLDFTVKMWDYANCTLLLSKHYPKLVCGVSIHPTGLYSITAFSDHVEFQMVQIDDLVPMKHFPIRLCTAIMFSGSGHMFAVARPGAIDIYCSLTFVKRFSCHGQLGTIEKLVWCNYDMNIVAYDIVGAIWTFDTKTGKVLAHIAPWTGAAYTDLAVAQNVNQLFVIAKDGSLKEVYDRKVKREVNFYGISLNAISITKSNSVLFIAAQNGVILSVKLPMEAPMKYKEFKMHSYSIIKMCLGTDGTVLVSCSENSDICLWEVKNTANKSKAINNAPQYTDDITINWLRYDKLHENIKKNEIALKKLEEESTINLNNMIRKKEQEIKEILTSNLERYYEAIKIKKDGILGQTIIISNLRFQLNQLRETNEQSILNLETYYNKELVQKYKKFSTLEKDGFLSTSGLKKNLEALQDKLELELQEASSNYKKQLRQKYEDNLKSKENLINEKYNIISLLGDTENHVDENVFSIKNKFSDKLHNIKELYSETSNDLAANKIKLKLYTNNINELMRSAELLENYKIELERAATKKNNRITDLTRLMKQCKEIIPQKEDQIIEVKQQMGLLIKDLNVLKEDIIELEKTTDPLEIEIQKITYSNEQYDIKLEVDINAQESLSKTKKKLQKTYDNKTELNRKSRILQNLSNTIKQMKIDMGMASRYYPDKFENKRLLTVFFNKHLGENHIREIKEKVIKGREEFLRQDNFLKFRIDSLKEMLKEFAKKNELYYSTMEENMNLINEISILRKNADIYLTKYNHSKHLLKVKTNLTEAKRVDELKEKKYKENNCK